jgi:8-oxo-dGTP pyrophosphatase MutT (NUDIX family)
MQTLRTRIATNLAAFPRIVIEPQERRRAAVGVVLSPQGNNATFILTRRALTMRRNAGNYALPGGNCDPGEDAIDTAIRETAEEVGVAIQREDALGLLDDFVTLGGHVVTPVVLWSPTPITLAPDPAEVHQAWLVPMAELDHGDSPRFTERNDEGESVLQMFIQGQWVNGPTAAWLYQFREVALYGRDTRITGVGQPSWTRN